MAAVVIYELRAVKC